MPEDAVWGLRKEDLRSCFLALQNYAQNPYPLNTIPTATSPVALSPPKSTETLPLAPLLRLPLEIRQLIYAHLLPPPVTTPIRGPHPRQLQSHIHLTQPILPSLLIINQQIRREALPLVYGSLDQVIHVTVDYNLWIHKTRRGDLVLSSALTSSMKHIHITINLGSEKRTTKPHTIESEARIAQVNKGIKKVRKWLAGADLQCLTISWQEPAQTYTWEQKKDVLDGLRGLSAVRVEAGQINWGLTWNKGRKYRFEVEYLKELERAWQEESMT
jgi:hypothetical protein